MDHSRSSVYRTAPSFPGGHSCEGTNREPTDNDRFDRYSEPYRTDYVVKQETEELALTLTTME